MRQSWPECLHVDLRSGCVSLCPLSFLSRGPRCMLSTLMRIVFLLSLIHLQKWPHCWIHVELMPVLQLKTVDTEQWFQLMLNSASPSSVMVPLLEPPLLLERGWEEAEDRESPGPVWGLGVGEGDGVRVGDVLLEVEEFPDWGLFFSSIFYKGMRAQ